MEGFPQLQVALVSNENFIEAFPIDGVVLLLKIVSKNVRKESILKFIIGCIYGVFQLNVPQIKCLLGHQKCIFKA